MLVPEMVTLSKWIGEEIIELINNGRKEDGEVKREGKFSTIRIIWLCLHVAHSGRSSLFEIMKTALSQQSTLKTLTESGFCKARARFSPQVV
jgi:hypothetical protein